MPACRILGLDPGSLRTGFGVIDCSAAGERYVASGCIAVGGAELVVRLRRIFEAVAALVEEHRPDEIAVERVFVHRNPDSALKLGQARGAALCAAVALGADEADALAVALCHAQTRRLASIVAAPVVRVRGAARAAVRGGARP